MQVLDKEHLIHKRKAWTQEGRTLLPLLTVWGIQWILSAGLDVAEEWYNLERAKLLILLLAVIVSAGMIIRSIINWKQSVSNTNIEVSGKPLIRAFSLLIPGILLLAAVLLLEGIGAVGPLFIPIFRSCIVAIVYVQFGVMLGRSLIYLGLWLFALTAVMGIWYLGYSGVVLEGMGGISLLICGFMLRMWSR